MVRFPDGSERPYWNTFYQEVRYPRPDAQDLMAATGLQYASAAALSSSINTQLDAGRAVPDLDLVRFDAHRDHVAEYLDSLRTYLRQMYLNINY